MDLNQDIYVPTIFDAVQDGDINMIIQMIGSDPTLVNAADASGFTPLMLACRNGSSSIVEVLLKAGADPLKATYSSGNNSLFWACYTGHSQVAKQLIEHVKANTSRGGLLQFIAIKNRNGDTALMFAANAGAHQIAHLLQSEGADLTVTNNSKMTALHCAAANQHFETVAGLINSYLSVNKNTLQRRQQLQKTINARDQQGRTALLMAATHGATSVIELLLEHGADLTCKNNANESALDIAKKSLESARDNDTKARLMKCAELLQEKWHKLETESQALADLLLEEENKDTSNNTKNTSDAKKKKQKKKTKANPNAANKTNEVQKASPLTPVTSSTTPIAEIKKSVDAVLAHHSDKQIKATPVKQNNNAAQETQTSNNTNTSAAATAKQSFSYASIVSKNLPPRTADTPPVTPSKLHSSAVTPKRVRRQEQYDTNNDEDVQELLRKAQAYDLLQQSLESMHPQAAQLGLECEHMFGLNLSSLSMSQLSALEELHFDALKQLSEAKVDYVRDLEQIRQEERLALERMIMRLTQQLNENSSN